VLDEYFVDDRFLRVLRASFQDHACPYACICEVHRPARYSQKAHAEIEGLFTEDLHTNVIAALIFMLSDEDERLKSVAVNALLNAVESEEAVVRTHECASMVLRT
jgi:hypothetical protein